MVMISHKAKHPPKNLHPTYFHFMYFKTKLGCHIVFLLFANGPSCFPLYQNSCKNTQGIPTVQVQCVQPQEQAQGKTSKPHSPSQFLQQESRLLLGLLQNHTYLLHISVMGEQVDFPHILGNPNCKGNHTRLECHQHVFYSLF